jgi:Raf kinase inhibitor-like YbhB/YbcL family protein
MLRYLKAVMPGVTMVVLSTAGAQTPRFVLTSPDVHSGRKIGTSHVLDVMGCTGDNISPALQWSRAPADTKSFAITIYDPDAPTGSGFWHWVVYNIPATVTRVASGAGDPKKNLLPAGAVQGITDLGAPGYVGPCPPKGDPAHHYIYTVHALDTDRLDLPAGSTPAFVGFNLHAHRIAKATMTPIFAR